MRPIIACALAVLLTCNMAAIAWAGDRVALVIGNSAYAHVSPLENPANDAADIAAALDRIGFDTVLRPNLTAQGLRDALRQFAGRAEGAEMAVLYFAGHGMEIDGRNYLIPVDAVIETARDVPYVGVQTDQFLRAVDGASGLQLVLLDACRNNPFAAQLTGDTRSIGRGLAPIEPPAGVLVGYAARGGTVAYDGVGRNSPYAAALLANLERPGLEIGRLFRTVRDSVVVATSGKQEPFTYGSLPARDIYLGPEGPDPARDVLQAFARASLENSVTGGTGFWQTMGKSAPIPRSLPARSRPWLG